MYLVSVPFILYYTNIYLSKEKWKQTYANYAGMKQYLDIEIAYMYSKICNRNFFLFGFRVYVIEIKVQVVFSIFLYIPLRVCTSPDMYVYERTPIN